MNEIERIRSSYNLIKDEKRAENNKKYLKSEYNFYGLKVPEMRKIVKEYKNLEFHEALILFDELWNSGNHEEMNSALYILEEYVNKYPLEVWNFIIKRINKATSWDLTDEISTKILGKILYRDTNLIREIKGLSKNKSPWIRRISMVSTLPLIKKNKIEFTLILAENFIYDDNIYVQKGAGWMLREVGKKDRLTLRNFILNHLDMKPYAFSYATEKMTELRKIRKERGL